MLSDKQALIQALFDIGVFQFGDYTLKSGEETSIYINLRKIITYPAVLRMTAQMVWQAIKDHEFKFICGVPYTALPIATCVSVTHDVPMLMRRREKKAYGTKQSIEGDYKAGDSCLVIEDVITSGASILETIQDLEASQLVVNRVIILIDREQKITPALSAYPTEVLLTVSEIFQYLYDAHLLDEHQIALFQQHMRKIA